MRILTQEQNDRLERFMEEGDKIYNLETLKEISHSSSQILQIITYHLVYEYQIEKWIDFKINNGKPLFKNIEKVGFHNKLYIARNLGMPKDLFVALDSINKERNKFAHQVFKKELTEEEIRKIGAVVDAINIDSGKFSTIKIPINGKHLGESDLKNCRALLYILLTALQNHLSNFVFIDIHGSNSREIS